MRKNTLVVSAVLILLALMKVSWHYYLRDDGLVMRANATDCEFSGLSGWVKSYRADNESALLKEWGARLTKVTARKAKVLISN